MNQILIINDNYKSMGNNKHNKKYLFIFFISINICILILLYFSCSFISRLNDLQTTNLLKSKYNISTLYQSTSNHAILILSNNVPIIGLIEIPKIDISYPIIENTNEDLLKISVCRFAGPLPNRIGNLCIAGHNYKNSLLFSKLATLNIGDSIYITDLNNTKLEYIIYDKLIISEDNWDCIKDTNNIEITLITCNNTNNNERIVIKAKVKG